MQQPGSEHTLGDDHLPPTYVKVPVALAYGSDLADGVLVTLVRILGLCWNGERTPPLSYDELSRLLRRPRSTLIRHLGILKTDDGDPHHSPWIHVEEIDRRLCIRPLVKIPVPDGTGKQETGHRNSGIRESGDGKARHAQSQKGSVARRLGALATIGVENPKREQLARQPIEPTCIHAWHLWAKHPDRRCLTNPVGFVIRQLERGERPPGEFLQEAARLLQDGRSSDQTDPVDREEPGPECEELPNFAKARRLWDAVLGELSLSMSRATFQTWLAGSRVVEVHGDRLAVEVRHARGIPWLENRLMPIIQRALNRCAGRELEVWFVAKQVQP